MDYVLAFVTKNKAHAGKDNGAVGMYRCRHLGNRLV